MISISLNPEGGSYPKEFVRKLSSLSGLGGNRKKSGTIPKELGSENGYESDQSEKSDNFYTSEACPKIYNYKHEGSIFAVSRPTLEQLRNPNDNIPIKKQISQFQAQTLPSSGKIGWVEGTLLRCLLNIWGVMLFLRLSWVVAQAGIGLAIVIILLSATVTTLTALSMSAICTNGQLKGGGIYYMISRSLGPEFGGAVGVIFSFANAAGVAMHTVGFSESLNDLLKTLQVKIVDNAENDVRITGTVALIILQTIIIFGTEWESKALIVLLIIFLTAIADFLIGVLIGPQDSDEFTRGFVGFNATVLANNFFPDFREQDGKNYNFITVFSIFFPSVTGIANISPNLKDPANSIPKGTLVAILITTISYIIFVILVGSTCLRDATGPLNKGLHNSNVTEEFIKNWGFVCNPTLQDCSWGSRNNFQIMELVSVFGPIIYAGLSTALLSLLSSPKIFQALCKDKLYPYIEVFGRGFRKNNDPFYAYFLTFCIALTLILIADLNLIAPLISNLCMAAYALVNFSVLHAIIIKPLGFRPTFKYFNKYSSFAGFALCVSIMFLMSWITALITLFIVASLYCILVHLKPDVNWGTSSEAQTFTNALKSIHSLNYVQNHNIQNYRPQVLVLSGHPATRPALIDFAHLLTKNISMLICGNIIQDRQVYQVRENLIHEGYEFLNSKRIRGFYSVVDDVGFEEGARCLMQASGIGKMRPNIVLLGFKSDWTSCDFEAYFRVILDALETHMGVAILMRLNEGIDYSAKSPEIVDKNIIFNFDGIELGQNVIDNLAQVQRKQGKSTIDIWWLYDDGGLTILLPYILKSRNIYKDCKLRFFTVVENGNDKGIQTKLTNLLGKFGINFSDLIVITDVSKNASEKSWKLFNSLIQNYQKVADSASQIEESELKLMKSETNHHLWIRELVQEHSNHANLVVLTLPSPKRDGISPGLYLSWLECLTKDLTGACLLVRGNKESCPNSFVNF